MGKQTEVVEEVVKHPKSGKFFVANRAEEVPKSQVEKRGPFYWKKRDSK
jgi:hypothetical protein